MFVWGCYGVWGLCGWVVGVVGLGGVVWRVGVSGVLVVGGWVCVLVG